MEKEPKPQTYCSDKHYFKRHHHHHGSSNAIYGLGVIGAFVYYFQQATGFVTVMYAIGKAFFWPAILMFKLLTYLHM